MGEITDINHSLDQYESNIEDIETLHQKLLNEVSEEQEEYVRKQLDSKIAQTSSMSNSLKMRIKKAQAAGLHDESKNKQAEACKNRFMNLIQNYRKVEADHRERSKQRAARQYKIIRPEASEDEVRDAIEDTSGQQIFSQALLNTNRRGEARSALNEVQNRHRELVKLEKTMGELAQLFSDMEELVTEQDVAIQQIDEQVERAQIDIEQGVGNTDKAVVSAKKSRKWKCWCFWIAILIIIIIVIAVVVSVLKK